MRRSVLVLLGATLLGVAAAQEGDPNAAPAPPAPAAGEAAPPSAPGAAPEGQRGQAHQQRELSDEARDLLAIIELPVAAHEARDRGVSKKVVKELVEGLRDGKVDAAEASRIVKAAARDKAKAEKLGELVTTKIQSGLRGTELAAAIHEVQGGRKGEKGDKGEKGEKGEKGPEGEAKGKEPATFAPGGPLGAEKPAEPGGGKPEEHGAGKPEEHGEGKGKGKGKGGH